MSAPEPERGVQTRRGDLGARRARQFMVAQTSLLGIAVVLVALTSLAQATSAVGHGQGGLLDVTFVQNIVFCVVMGMVTAVGWVGLGRASDFPRLVVSLLYVDSILALVYAYAAGEFETPAMIIPILGVIMAPIFVGRRHVWRIATTQVVLYAVLLGLRQSGWMEHLLPYGYMLPQASVLEPRFVLACLSNFTIATFGVAYLAGQASIDILNSQSELEEEVATKTSALEVARQDLETANLVLERTNADLGRANRDLSLSNSRLDQFNAAVSHDLRSPLQTMVARAELVAMLVRMNPDRAERMTDEIIAAAQQMSLQIDELLKLARVGDRLGDLEPVALARVVSQASEGLQQRMRSCDARLELVHPLPTALGNGPLLQELFQNLMENAIKYGDASHPLIRVEQAPAGDGEVAIAVEDNGPGIPAAHRDQIFGLFKQLGDPRGQDGVGAGLAIVKRIVEVHGGRITAGDAQALDGARFVVVLQACGPGADGHPDRAEPPRRVH